MALVSKSPLPRGLFGCAIALSLAACRSAPPLSPSGSHIGMEPAKATAAAAIIPQPVDIPAALPKPKPAPRQETYSVVVNNVKVQELLFALARDAKINVDVHPGLNGTVTLNAIDQTLPQLLSRISRQVDMRYEIDGPNLVVMPDSPFLRTYRVDYVNLSRDTESVVSINTQIATLSPASAAVTDGARSAPVSSGGNLSNTRIVNTGKHRFWESLEKNIKDILRETDKILPEGSSETVVETEDVQTTTGTGAQPGLRSRKSPGSPGIASSPNPAALEATGRQVVTRTTFREAASVIVNSEAGVVTVRATARQHEKVLEFLDHVMAGAKRQVLIEATIVEVTLNKGYQQGIDWQYLRNQGSQVAIGQGVTSRTIDPVSGSLLTSASTLTSSVANTVFTAAFRNGGFTAAVQLLESFGTVKVLSSPRLSVLNNQTALLKVVDNLVYFNVKADTTQSQTNTLTTFSTTPQSVSVGLVMSVTPQVGESDTVTLNVRPSISRVTGTRRDPNPSIPQSVLNLIPEIQTREMESILRVTNGEIAVLGGLMQDSIDYKDDAVPVASRIPFLGNLFTHRNDSVNKTELVIFLRPIVIRDPSLDGDYRGYRERLPTAEYFRNNPNPPLPQWELGTR